MRLLAKVFYTVSLSAFAALLFYGGLGIERELAVLIGFYISLIFLMSAIFLKKKFSLPRYFLPYAIFLALLFINYLFSFDPQETLFYLHLYLSGGLVWLAFHNMDWKEVVIFKKIILAFALFFSVLFLLNFNKGNPVDNSFSLYASTYGNHNHLGDLWAIVLASFLPVVWSHKSRKLHDNLPIILIGLIILLLSFSRSAHLSLIVAAVFYLWKKEPDFLVEKKKIILIVLFAFLVFAFAGLGKSTFLSRILYFKEAIIAFRDFPFGIGVGNFGAYYFQRLPEGLAEPGLFTSVTHNILLEFMVGMGILGLSFLYFIYKVFSEVFAKDNKKKMVYQTMFIALTVNFMFDYTYILLPLVWIWFWLLASLQQEKK